MAGGFTSARNWKIRVSQIPCNEGFAGKQMRFLFFFHSVFLTNKKLIKI